MTKCEIFNVIKKNICDILPDVQECDIEIEQKLKELGANSIDRADVVVQSMEDLKLKIALVEFGKARNIEGLVDIFYGHQSLQ